MQQHSPVVENIHITPDGEARLETVRLDTVQPQDIKWLWEPRFALGKVSLIAGDPGRGKSLITIAMAAAVTRGFKWPVDNSTAPLGSVLMLSAEDDIADTIRPRLDAAGADVSKVHCVTFVSDETDSRRCFSLQTDVDLLASKLSELADCKLVIIDPISAFTGSTDTHKNSDVRVLLATLSDIAQRHEVAILSVSHLNKGQGNAMYRTMGSLAFVAAARAVYAVADDLDDPQRRLVLPVKNNLGNDTTGLAYKIEVAASGAPVIAWENEAVTDDIEAVLNAGASDQRSELSEAVQWLASEVSGGPVDTKVLKARANESGHSWRTVRRAQEQLKVKARKTGANGGWQWWHPEEAFQGVQDTPVRNVGHLGHLEGKSHLNGQGVQGVQDAGTGESGHVGDEEARL